MDRAGTPCESRMGWAYPDMYRAGTPGTMARTAAATSLPIISGITTSVSNRSTVCPGVWASSMALLPVAVACTRYPCRVRIRLVRSRRLVSSSTSSTVSPCPSRLADWAAVTSVGRARSEVAGSSTLNAVPRPGSE